MPHGSFDLGVQMSDEDLTVDVNTSNTQQVPTANESDVVARYRARQKERLARLYGPTAT